MDVKYNRIQQGLGLGIPEIDEHLRFKKSTFNVIVGHPNTGKTTVIMYLMTAYSLKHNLKWLIFSSENTSYSIARKVVEFKSGKPVNQLSDSEIAEGMEWCDEHFKIMEVNSVYNARQLMKEATQIKEEYNYDGLLIDPYNSLAKDTSLLRSVGSHEYDYQIASEMRLFAKEYNVTIWLNTHAVTEALRRTYPKDHEYAGHPSPPSMADVEGGGKWGNRADDVYTIHRLTMHPNLWMVSDIHVRKIKEVETGGRCTSIDSPLSLRMNIGNAGFSFAGSDIIHSTKTKINDLLL